MEYRTLRAFLGIAGLYAAATTAAYFFLRWYRPTMFHSFLPVAVLGLLLACSWGYLWGSQRYFQEARLIMQSFAYSKLEDGERVFISGPIEPLAPAFPCQPKQVFKLLA